MYNLRLLRQLRYSLVLQNSGTSLAPLPPCRLLAGQHKRRPQLGALPSDQLDRLKSEYFERQCALSNEDWQHVRSTLTESYRHVNGTNVDAIILGLCSKAEQLPVAKSFVEHLKTQGIKPNAATMGRLLRVYNAAYHTRELSEAEQSEIVEICDTLQNAHDVLDASSCENLILGLVATTHHWDRALPLLDMMRLTSTPSVSAYSALIAKAFSADQLELGWRLLDEMVQARKMPKCEIFLSLLAHSAKDERTLSVQLERLFCFLELHDILISELVAQQLLALAQRLPQRLQVSTTRLERFGKCSNCQQNLQHVAISDAQFTELRESFLQKVLIRNDVFQKTTPEELQRFKQYVEKTAPYDCVIDGLNVAYSTGTKKPPAQLAKLLATVVRYFKERRKRVLVLGRQHMRNWSKPAMQYIQSNASVFFTSNLTHDDPFLLYATLRSGQDTDFFSRDLMRAHAHLLGTELKAIFRRWQQEHQYSLVTQTQTGQIIVKEPIRYRLSAHKVGNVWHVPCCEAYSANPPDSFEVPEKWLCITIAP
ncbi:hypothetical protein AWZ03_011114 [Drosophila navojoa]|uniref:Mitochondrial ribonuclease P catalytic subunit n=1 Tax=Drosophila navojoa TaxID=7232 RepID=A0A484B308_DRONA|nr:mitochondrial ribonuclease P catalytic subunit [Drosophila navojoa]TDG42460.1 hypothetical protein AWZ03_011114 [Drosophila navojoa]